MFIFELVKKIISLLLFKINIDSEIGVKSRSDPLIFNNHAMDSQSVIIIESAKYFFKGPFATSPSFGSFITSPSKLKRALCQAHSEYSSDDSQFSDGKMLSHLVTKTGTNAYPRATFEAYNINAFRVIFLFFKANLKLFNQTI